MGDPVWEMSYAVETDADLEFAWSYWSNVKNWDDPPARSELEGGFADGARGTTWVGEQLTMHWVVPNVTGVVRRESGGGGGTGEGTGNDFAAGDEEIGGGD